MAEIHSLSQLHYQRLKDQEHELNGQPFSKRYAALGGLSKETDEEDKHVETDVALTLTPLV